MKYLQPGVMQQTINQLKSQKMKNKTYHTVGTVPKYIRKIVKKGKIDTPSTQNYTADFPGFGTCTSIKSSGVKIDCCAQISPLSRS